MAEYYRPERKRTSAGDADKTPYRKIFLRQLIAALICFTLIKYICTGGFSFSDSLKARLKDAVNHNTDISFLNQMKINGADTNEFEAKTKTEKN